MTRRELLGVGAAACVACCLGPLYGAIAAVGLTGILSTVVVGWIGLAVAGLAAVALAVRARRRRAEAGAVPGPTPVDGPRRR